MGDVCVDPLGCARHPEGEPNDDEASAVSLPETSCGIVEEALGAIDQGDEDWFTFHGLEQGNRTEDTIAIVDSGDVDLPVCMFWECDQGNANAQVTCPGGATATASPDGRLGCCAVGSVLFANNVCLGAAANDNGDVYIRVQGPADPVCVEYALAYRFL